MFNFSGGCKWFSILEPPKNQYKPLNLSGWETPFVLGQGWPIFRGATLVLKGRYLIILDSRRKMAMFAKLSCGI